ncbi:MAG: hypothetical protein A2845_00480 [Candidatus Lloydbacteria bacterium RIFCSPHIGHO2_01_FULL_49_22]|uniref:Uncharacterized protein n=1 Tax=Candidatus Lloydbacteria bacterium RIFCSPHIGHO2_01_FULL_49_22 TaxID=1798658 RepID=A0A1G2D0I1_9BACT|nr:MAG: hypothetical protein A2845_00480 [Candidatus Lloydbacteria bacterium RIFCSPHIGHO2_01_FULL_49_22]OGZ09339.1 MAG: hypothetical protein A3C14_05385 [Candidatus Lloydbacteria bacterium RIFCSPHIGHO2_02_FULL_50_18]
MSLFGPIRPNGITKEELHFIRGELANAPFGHSADKLTSFEVDEIMEDLDDAMDPDTPNDMRYGWAQVSPAEVADIEKDAANNKRFKYSSAKLKHIHDVLGKYLTINRVKSVF